MCKSVLQEDSYAWVVNLLNGSIYLCNSLYVYMQGYLWRISLLNIMSKLIIITKLIIYSSYSYVVSQLSIFWKLILSIHKCWSPVFEINTNTLIEHTDKIFFIIALQYNMTYIYSKRLMTVTSVKKRVCSNTAWNYTAAEEGSQFKRANISWEPMVKLYGELLKWGRL